VNHCRQPEPIGISVFPEGKGWDVKVHEFDFRDNSWSTRGAAFPPVGLA
jgi:hypothetical protein